MHPQKELRLRVVIQPGDGARDHLVASTLGDWRARIARDRRTKASIVGLEAAVEALRQPVLWVEINRADKSCRVVALRLQQVRKVKERRRQRAANRAHARALRIGSGQDGRVRNDARRCLSIGMLKDDAFSGKTV